MSQRKRSPLGAVLSILAAMTVASCGECAGGFTTTFLNLGAGEDHFLLTRTSTGAKLGNIVVVRKDQRLATYSLVGVYADDAESVNEVFGEKLEALETWTP